MILKTVANLIQLGTAVKQEITWNKMKIKLFFVRSRDSTIDVVTALRTRQPKNRYSIPGRGKRFVSACLRSFQPCIRCVPRTLL